MYDVWHGFGDQAVVQVQVDTSWYDDETHIQGYTVTVAPRDVFLVDPQDMTTGELHDVFWGHDNLAGYLGPDDLAQHYEFTADDCLAAAFLAFPDPTEPARALLTAEDLAHVRPILENWQTARIRRLEQLLALVRTRQDQLGLPPVFPPVQPLT